MTQETQQQTQTAGDAGSGASGSQPTSSTEGQTLLDGQQGQANEGAGASTDAQQAPQGAPERYEFKPIEGVEFDSTVMDAFSAVAKELNLSQTAAQQVVDKVAPLMAAQQLAEIEAAKSAWADSAKADKELAADGGFDANLATAAAGLKAVGTPELTALLNDTGLGNHPEIIRAFYKIGKLTREDTVATGHRAAAPADKGDARSLYPNSAMN